MESSFGVGLFAKFDTQVNGSMGLLHTALQPETRKWCDGWLGPICGENISSLRTKLSA